MTQWLGKRRGQGLGWFGLLGGLTLAGCGLLPSTALLPPCVDDDCDCGDFIEQPLAQQVLEAEWGDPHNLDSDRNGRACEQLPAAAPPLDPPTVLSSSPHLILGNPSNSGTNPNNYLIERQQYALAYSRDRRLANWVSWHLDSGWIGPSDRQDDFRQDGSLPAGFYQVTANDFRDSGYDRGHLVPSADRTRTIQDNSATFLMTNIIPQAPENNRGVWRELEEYTRELVKLGNRDVYVIAGTYGSQGNLGKSQVTVPSRLWKVVVVLDRPDAGIDGVSATSQIIAIDVPNQDALKPDWRDYQTSIDRIELATGYDLLANLPDAIEQVLEARTSLE
ncbi:DNA/RNA endonuclease G [filamentous cyanobacterium CCP5]|nr:DNA/RNA endonuclease G [filamentous cyanobacterium CCP5]